MGGARFARAPPYGGFGVFYDRLGQFQVDFCLFLKIMGIISRRPDLIRDCDFKDLALDWQRHHGSLYIRENLKVTFAGSHPGWMENRTWS